MILLSLQPLDLRLCWVIQPLPFIQVTMIEGRTVEQKHALIKEVSEAVARTLGALREAASGTGSLMPRILDAVRAYATLGEMCDALRGVWGEYTETPIL